MRMDHEELASRLEQRLDKIEKKLDKHLEVSTVNAADISWVKGYIKISISAILAVIAGLVTAIFQIFK